jgi:hypothetical protein
MKKILLVDFENVPKVDLSALPTDVTVPFFFGASQRTVPTAFLKEALKLGERFIPIDIEGQGKNALDFHIAFYLGEYLQAAPTAECVILSRDKGFDPLVRHLTGRGFHVRRVGAIQEAFVAPVAIAAPTRGRRKQATAKAPSARAPRKSAADATPPELEHARAHLSKTPSRNLPRSRTRLAAMLHSVFARKLDAERIGAIIDGLVADGSVNEANGALSYPGH